MKYVCLLFLIITHLNAMERQKIFKDLIELACIIDPSIPSDGNLFPEKTNSVAAITNEKPNTQQKRQVSFGSVTTTVIKKVRPSPAQEITKSGITFRRIHIKDAHPKYICVECNRQYSNPEVHALTHTRERPHECVCGKSFRQRAHLVGHEKICPKVQVHKHAMKPRKSLADMQKDDSPINIMD